MSSFSQYRDLIANLRDNLPGEPLSLLGAIPIQEEVQEGETMAYENSRRSSHLCRAASDQTRPGGSSFLNQHCDVAGIGERLWVTPRCCSRCSDLLEHSIQ